jgi:glyoxylase-like metal-dependent hydrolase (beta-lactamase superfamily II)
MRAARFALLGLALAFAPAPPLLAKRIGEFKVEELAKGVTLFSGEANSIVVERKDGLLVIDAQPSVDAGRALLAAIAKVSKQPVRYLVLTHPHADACGGAAAFPPSTLVVMSSAARDRLADSAYDFGAEVKRRAADPAAWTSPDRPVPVLHADGPFTLEDPDRRVVIYPLPRAHAEGNLYVDIPQAGLLAVGDLVVTDRNPFAGDDASVGQWIAILSDLAQIEKARLVPLDGPPVDPESVRTLRDALAWARGRVHKGFVDGEPPDEIVERSLADPKAATWFDLSAKPSFARLVLSRVLAETQEERKKRGAD